MARAREMIVAQSLMERLGEEVNWPTTQSASLRMLKESIRRDLEALLNTRRPMPRELECYEAAACSVLNYGLDDLSTLRVEPNGYLQEMQRAIQFCLATYEPRLTNVKVSLEDGDLMHRQIRLHIEAILPVHPAIQIVTFNTTFDLTSETYTVG